MALNIIFTNEDSDSQQALASGTLYVNIGETQEAVTTAREVSLILDSEKNNEQDAEKQNNANDGDVHDYSSSNAARLHSKCFCSKCRRKRYRRG